MTIKEILERNQEALKSFQVVCADGKKYSVQSQQDVASLPELERRPLVIWWDDQIIAFETTWKIVGADEGFFVLDPLGEVRVISREDISIGTYPTQFFFDNWQEYDHKHTQSN